MKINISDVKNASFRKVLISKSDHVGITVLTSPIKAVIDEKQYKTIRLANGLTALLISDPVGINKEICDIDEKPTWDGSSMENSEESILTESDLDSKDNMVYCSVNVNVGYFSDPENIPGLAHFVEHLLFMGSDKYPGINDFFSFIGKNFGMSNAITQKEMTTYYFAVARDKLREALDIFSQFFISPRFKKGAIDKEINSIQSEYTLSKLEYKLISIYHSLYPPGHPNRKFACGNTLTLRDNVDGDTLHRSTIQFWKRHYRADKITMVLQGGYDLDILEEYVVNFFGQIQNNGQPADDLSQYPYNENFVTRNFTKLYFIKPHVPTNDLLLAWILPVKFTTYKENSLLYLQYMIEQGNEGGLCKYLISKNWVVYCYSVRDTTTLTADLHVIFTLTNEGIHHINQIVESFFSYMKMLKEETPSERIFNEIKLMGMTKFSYPEDKFRGIEISQNMVKCSPEHYLTCNDFLYNFDPDLIAELFGHIDPKTMSVMIISTELNDINYNQKEKWYGGQFRQEDIPSEYMERWLKAKRNPYFKMPEKNKYLPNDFTLKDPPQQYRDRARNLNIDLKTADLRHIFNAEENMKNKNRVETFKKDDLFATVNYFRLDQPNLFHKNDGIELLYKPNYKSKLPVTIIFILILSPVGFESAKRFCIFTIWKDIMLNSLLDNSYDARLAGISTTISITNRGLAFKFKGYNQKLPKFVEASIRYILTKKINDKEFKIARNKRKQSLLKIIKSHNVYRSIHGFVTRDLTFDNLMLYQVIDTITHEDLLDFYQEYFQCLFLKFLIVGNTPWYEAMELSQSIMKIIDYQPFDVELQLKHTRYRIPKGNNIIRIRDFDKKTKESLVHNYYQGGVETPNDVAILEIISKEICSYLFDELRTKQQLGYGVICHRHSNIISGFVVSVYPTTYSTSYVDSAIDTAIRHFSLRPSRKLMWQIKNNTQTLSIRELIHFMDKEALDESAYNYIQEILYNRYDFQRVFKVRKALLHLKLSHVIEWYNKYFPVENSKEFSKLSIQIVGTSDDDDKADKDDKDKTEYLAVTENLDETENFDETENLDVTENLDETESLDETVHLKYEYLTLDEPVPEAVATDPSSFITDIYTFQHSLEPFNIPRRKIP